MRRLARIYRWIFRHHYCSLCRCPRPAWLPGDHTSCILFNVEQMRRHEADRLRRCRECGEQGTHKGTCGYSAMRNPGHPIHRGQSW